MQTYTKWTAMWGNAMSIAEHKAEEYSKNITLRYPIYAPFNGSALRFTFDNFCGTEAITISRAVVAVSTDEKSIDTTTTTTITFDGKASCTVPAGKTLVSDAVSFAVKAGQTLSVSFYLADFTQMRSAVLITGPLSKGFYSVGDVCDTKTLPLDTTRKTNWFYFLSTVDILTEEKNRALICYGDSITAQDWPDYLTLQLQREGITNTSIIRRAASGTRILREYTCITYESYGLQGNHRVPRELQVAGADAVIIQQGINDIIHPVGTDVNPFRPMSDLPTVQDLTDGLAWYVEQARELGLSVYMGTLLPIYGWRTYASFREDMKNEVNDWIRHTNLIDGCIDFDKALCDEANPAAFASGFDSGDHLHPSTSAYQAMANTAFVAMANKYFKN
ncbi:MAG: lipase [Lachnospiraceae bacterium]|nr:lipase [Lachnospiraceae bacterium]